VLTHDLLLRLCRAREQLGDTNDPCLPLSQIACEAQLSPTQFIRRFAAVFGETPHQYRIRARLERARQILALGETSVTDVCMMVGFDSLGSFSWLFSRRYGESPCAFRKRLSSCVETPASLPPQMQPGCITLMTAAWPAAPQFSRSASGPDFA